MNEVHSYFFDNNVFFNICFIDEYFQFLQFFFNVLDLRVSNSNHFFSKCNISNRCTVAVT
ncbi:hypothetical protein [uncultured Methanolobus sp.]|uniref:hypothetical protein n=1 Tax=uncultured Methanolobus sp. TaxID=218300 RepID=UPI0029C60977|nr:hypothetical protein [uncultured Methanolobus sp.]